MLSPRGAVTVPIVALAPRVSAPSERQEPAHREMTGSCGMIPTRLQYAPAQTFGLDGTVHRGLLIVRRLDDLPPAATGGPTARGPDDPVAIIRGLGLLTASRTASRDQGESVLGLLGHASGIHVPT